LVVRNQKVQTLHHRLFSDESRFLLESSRVVKEAST